MRGLKPPQRRPKNASAFAAQVRVVAPPVDLSAYATTEYVDAAVAAGGGGAWSPLDRHVVNYWPLDEDTSAQSFLDKGPANNTLLPFGGAGPGVVDGVTGSRGARSFDGSAQAGKNITPNDLTAQSCLGSWTLEGWFYLSDSTGGIIWNVIGNNSNTLGSGGRFSLGPNGMAMEWLWGGDAVNIVDSSWNLTGGISSATWHHFACRKTLDRVAGTVTVEFFLDNNLKQTVAGLHNCETGTNTAQWTTWIGAAGGAGGGGYFPGRLQLLRFSSKARTDQEIADFYTYSPTLG